MILCPMADLVRSGFMRKETPSSRARRRNLPARGSGSTPAEPVDPRQSPRDDTGAAPGNVRFPETTPLMTNRIIVIMAMMIVCFTRNARAVEDADIVNIVYPDSRFVDLTKRSNLNVEKRKSLVASFVDEIESSPIKKHLGGWHDPGFPVILTDKDMNPIRAYKVFNFPISKGVFIECEVAKDGEGFKLGKVHIEFMADEFKAKRWPEFSKWISEKGFTDLSDAMKSEGAR